MYFSAGLHRLTWAWSIPRLPRSFVFCSWQLKFELPMPQKLILEASKLSWQLGFLAGSQKWSFLKRAGSCKATPPAPRHASWKRNETASKKRFSGSLRPSALQRSGAQASNILRARATWHRPPEHLRNNTPSMQWRKLQRCWKLLSSGFSYDQ